MKNKVKFYNKSWFMWLTLIFFSPVGIFFMWKNKKFTKRTRKVLTAVFAVWFLIVFASSNGSNSNKDVSVNKKTEATKKTAKKSENDNKKEEAKKSEEKKVASAAETGVSVNGQLKVHYINVGQADAILLQQGSSSMLIDAGNNADGDTVKNYIDKLGINQLDFVVGTHPHEDHIGGLDYVINSFKIGKIYLPKATSTTKTYMDVANAISAKGMKATAPVISESFKLGEATCTILAPNGTGYKDANNYSIVLRVTFGSTSFMFDGDAEDVSENEMLAKGLDVSANVLKVGHHGSTSSTTAAFLSKVNPQYAVISVGKGNDYGHPHQGTMEKLKAKGIKVYRTDENGTIICTSDGKNISFNNNEGSYNYAGAGTSSTSKSPSTANESSQTAQSTTSTGGNTNTQGTTSAPVQNEMKYIGNRGTKKFHNESCRYANEIKDKVIFNSREEAVNGGYSPCKTCHP